MSEPTTEAGWALLARSGLGVEPDEILAIEAEARQQERDRILTWALERNLRDTGTLRLIAFLADGEKP